MKPFHSFRGLVNEYLEGYTMLEESELRRRIQEAYEDDEISGTDYDHLMGLLEM